MTRISRCPVPLIIAPTVALLVTLVVPKPLTAQPEQSSTADTPISSEIPSPGSEPNPAQPASALDKSSIDSATDVEVQPASALDKSSIDAATDVEIQRRFNELKSELLDDRREFLDKRSKDVDWWLTAIIIFLTFFAIIVAIIGIFGFQRFREIEKEARQSVEALKEQEKQAGLTVEEIEAKHEKAESLLKDMNAETTHNNPDKASEVVKTVQQNPAASLIDRARADAISLQQRGKVEEAIEKWRSIAKVAEGVDSQLQARAWFSVGYLHGQEDHWKEAINAYNESIRLRPDNAVAYSNRGVAKRNLGQYKAALTDYDKAIKLDPDNTAAYNNRGYAKTNLGQYEEALTDSNKAIKLDPDNAAAYDTRGVAKAGLGRLNEAREDYQKALALAQESGNEALIAEVQHNLSQLDNAKAP